MNEKPIHKNNNAINKILFEQAKQLSKKNSEKQENQNIPKKKKRPFFYDV